MTIRTFNFATGEFAERELTAEELDALPPPEPPNYLRQIRELEAANADKVAKVTRQALLLQTVSIALATPEAQALTKDLPPKQARAAVISLLVATDPGFKLLFDLEQAIEQLRAQIP